MIILVGEDGEAEIEMDMCWEEWSKRENEKLELRLQRHQKEFSELEKEGERPKGEEPLLRESNLDLGSERKRISGE